jgi:DNA-binding MarR family transcriptional regulator
MKSPQTVPPVENDPADMKVITALSKVAIAVKSQSWKEASETGLTPTQGQILVHLNLWENEEPRISELAEALGVTVPTASKSISALVEKKLVRKNPSSNDARNVVISLTAKGKKTALKAAGWPDFLMGAVGVLTRDERTTFFRGLLKVIRTLQEKRQIPAVRMCLTCSYFRPNIYPDQSQPHHCAFVDAPFGDSDLVLDCPDHEKLSSEESKRIWEMFIGGMK